jgi:enterochelin esterase-like enzyme
MGDHQATCVKYTGCKDGIPVHWCSFEGGHEWQEWAHFTEAAFFNALP